MKGLVKTGKGVGLLEIREVSEPIPGAGEVLIKVKAAGICGTDIHIRHDQFPYYPPVILGHEFAGEIAAVGQGVKGWTVGDRVVAEPHARTCGVCDLCRAGYSQICAEKRSPGWGIDGAFAEYLTMPAALLHRVPDAISDESAAVAEPLAIVLHEAVERGQIQAGDRVVVFGAGPIGLLAAAVARLAGAAQVILVGTDQDRVYRFGVARGIPVDYIINASDEEVFATVQKLTQNKLADVAIEASGSPQAIAQTAMVIRKLGRIIAIGLPGEQPVSFPWQTAMFKVADLHFNMSSSHRSWLRALALMENGRFDPGFVVSHRFKLAEWEKAFDLSEKGQGTKVLFMPDREDG